MLNSGERQVATRREDVRRDHLARYEWAARQLPPGSRVVDVGCGIGYGAQILAEAGHQVLAVDIDVETIDFARQHFAHPGISYCVGNAMALDFEGLDAAVCFEVIEHLSEPRWLLEALRIKVPRLLASVPNESVFPWKGYAFHHRHYTAAEFLDLLLTAGLTPTAWFGQAGPESEVEPDLEGRTLVVDAMGAETLAPAAPEHVVLLGLGPSLEAYVDVAKRMGARRAFADEVWGINAVADIVHCDRVFHMDDVRVQEIRARARPESNIAAMLTWLKAHPGPVYTSVPHPDYPGLVAFPLEQVMNELDCPGYFNSTAAYAVALAIAIGVKRITLFGFDFTYPNAHHAEKGRACVEFYLGIAKARGIQIGLPDSTSLMDGCTTRDDRYYGYDGVEIASDYADDGRLTLSFTPRALPTAEEVEAAYDHSKHPNPLVAGQGQSGT